MHQEQIIKQTISQHYSVFENGPAGYKPLLIALHGYGENKESLRSLFKKYITSPAILVFLQAPFPHFVAAQSGNFSVGFGWITAFNSQEAVRLHHNALKQIIKKFKKDYSVSKIGLFGFSQSVALNFRFIFTFPNEIDFLFAVCGGIPGDWDKNNIYKNTSTKVNYFGGKKDPVYPISVIRTNTEKLKPKAKSMFIHEFEGGHTINTQVFSILNQVLLEKV